MGWQEKHGCQHHFHRYYQLRAQPTTTLQFDSHNAARSKCNIRRSPSREMWPADYLEELPSRETRKWWKQPNTHQRRRVSLVIRQWMHSQRNSGDHHMLEYIEQKIRATSGLWRRRPTSLMILYHQNADAATKGRRKQYSMRFNVNRDQQSMRRN